MRSGKDWITRYMKFVEDTEPAKLYHKWTAVMALAAVLKRKCWLRWGINKTLYPNLYAVLVGPPGNRKGTAMEIGEWFLNNLGVVTAPSSVTIEALIRLLRDVAVTETTADNHHITHSSLTVWSPEWKVFLGRKENYEMFSALTDWYDCADNWSRLTKTQGEDELTGVWFNMFGAITPTALRSVVPYEAEGGGFLSRIIFIYEEKAYKRVPDPFVTPALQKIGDKLTDDLHEIQQLSGTFQLTPDAFDYYRDFYIDMERTNPSLPMMFQGYLSRRQIQFLKLSMIMSVSESDDMIIDVKHMERGLKLLIETEVKMPRTFSGFGTAKDAQLLDDMMVYIAKRRKLHARDLFVQFRAFITDPRHMESLLSALVRQQFISMKPSVKGTVIKYNPNNPLHEQYGSQTKTKGSSGSSNTP
ncbi:MAG: DUF3987 domain-containing protein [Planctomycetes bacterium]|nr:DUF3987 domain-containing protein [Planctomycetota bacterium]